MKIFKAHMLNMDNKQWYAEVIKTWTNGKFTTQQTGLLETDYEVLEGQYYSPILMDVNSPNTANAIIEGEPMRGGCLEVALRAKTGNNEEKHLLNHSVGFIMSNNSNNL